MMLSTDVKNYRSCAYPPTKQKLAKEVALMLAKIEHSTPLQKVQMKRTAHHIKKKLPCKRWLLLVLAQISPDHFFFSKEHTKAIAKPHYSHFQTVPFPSNFLDDLQLPQRKKHGRRVNFIGNVGKQALKVERMKQFVNQFNQRVVAANERLQLF